jgi:2-keto-3-deoxy-L-rhamnonate aldolase RhmA
VLALTCHIELFSQAHYRASIGDAQGLSPLFKDVFLFHWKEESQHAIIDELEWIREDAKLVSAAQRDAAVDDLIALVGGVDGILQGQATADAAYFLGTMKLEGHPRAAEVQATLLKAYRWQYIVSGAMQPRFQEVLASLVDDAQMARIQEALGPLMYAVPAREQVAREMAH